MTPATGAPTIRSTSPGGGKCVAPGNVTVTPTVTNPDVVDKHSTSLISLRDFIESFALLVSSGYPGFLSAGMVHTIFKVDRTASQMNRWNWPNRNARISMVRGPGFTGENRVQRTAIQRFLRRNEIMAKR